MEEPKNDKSQEHKEDIRRATAKKERRYNEWHPAVWSNISVLVLLTINLYDNIDSLSSWKKLLNSRIAKGDRKIFNKPDKNQRKLFDFLGLVIRSLKSKKTPLLVFWRDLP